MANPISKTCFGCDEYVPIFSKVLALSLEDEDGLTVSGLFG